MRLTNFLALAKYKKSTCTVGQKRHALAELSNKHDGIGIHFILSTDLSQWHIFIQIARLQGCFSGKEGDLGVDLSPQGEPRK